MQAAGSRYVFSYIKTLNPKPFNNRIYRQRLGFATGVSFGASLAHIVLYELTRDLFFDKLAWDIRVKSKPRNIQRIVYLMTKLVFAEDRLGPFAARRSSATESMSIREMYGP